MRPLHTTVSTPKLPIYPYHSPPIFLKFLPFPQNSTNLSHKYRNRSITLEPRRIVKGSMSSTPSTAFSDGSSATNKPFSVLFVCLGNICRSPAAEGVFRHLVKQKDLHSKFFIDSAGTINYHEGNQAGPRMRAASKRRGIEITSLSRPIKSADFRDFDLILAMDKQNKEDTLEKFERWRHREALPSLYVLDLLEDACESLLESIVVTHG